MKSILRILMALLGIYAVMLLTLYLTQRSLMFSADPNRVQLAQANLSGVSEVILETDHGVQLICWHAQAKTGEPTFLIFHGNGGNIGGRGIVFRQLMAKGYGVFMLGYPGYGGSGGSPSEAAFVEAAELAYDHLIKNQISASDIVIYGESLGTGVATQLAADCDSRALILLAPLESAMHVARSQYPYVPVGWLLKDPFRTDLHIAKVDKPVLLIHGTSDSIIPIGNSHALFKLANEPKLLEAIEGAGHNNLYDFPVVDVIARFLNQHAKVPK